MSRSFIRYTEGDFFFIIKNQVQVGGWFQRVGIPNVGRPNIRYLALGRQVPLRYHMILSKIPHESL